ncbi:MAG TPA: hypothetical protein VKA85_09580 [Candidatus Limnocylindrales bacterium]|nr:hypothetical protein [Candidatus Limnocylindrales bacterium]
MRSSKFTRLGGAGALLGGILWVATLAVGQVLSADLVGIVVAPIICLVLGLAALQTRQGGKTGRLGLIGFLVALLGSVIMAYGSVGHLTLAGDVAGVTYGPVLFTGMALGTAIFGFGAVLTALSAIVANVLPRFSPIPMLVGAVGVAVIGGWTVAHQLMDGGPGQLFPIRTAPIIGLWAVFGVGWLWLGYLLWSEGRRDTSIR